MSRDMAYRGGGPSLRAPGNLTQSGAARLCGAHSLLGTRAWVQTGQNTGATHHLGSQQVGSQTGALGAGADPVLRGSEHLDARVGALHPVDVIPHSPRAVGARGRERSAEGSSHTAGIADDAVGHQRGATQGGVGTSTARRLQGREGGDSTQAHNCRCIWGTPASDAPSHISPATVPCQRCHRYNSSLQSKDCPMRICCRQGSTSFEGPCTPCTST